LNLQQDALHLEIWSVYVQRLLSDHEAMPMSHHMAGGTLFSVSYTLPHVGCQADSWCIQTDLGTNSERCRGRCTSSSSSMIFMTQTKTQKTCSSHKGYYWSIEFGGCISVTYQEYCGFSLGLPYMNNVLALLRVTISIRCSSAVPFHAGSWSAPGTHTEWTF